MVGQRPQDRLAGPGRVTDQGQDLRQQRLTQRDRGLDGRQVLGVQQPPRREGELHHREQGGALGEPDEQLLIDWYPVGEVGQLAAADHVRAVERVADQTLRDALGDQRQQTVPAPARRLVVQSLGQRPAAGLPAGPELVELVLGGERGPGLGVVGRAAAGRRHVAGPPVADVAGVELETIDTDVAQPIQLGAEPIQCGGVAQVEHRAPAVPPVPDHRLAVGSGDQQTVVLQPARDRAVGTDERHQPDHDVEPESMQLSGHRGRIREAGDIEGPVAVVDRPAIVDHQHPGREALVDHPAGIGQHPVLARLVVRHLDPGVPLRTCEHRRARGSAVGREESRRGGAEGGAQRRLPATAEDHLGLTVGGQRAGVEGVGERALGPDVPAGAGDQQRRRLIRPGVRLVDRAGVRAQVPAVRSGSEGHQQAVRDGTAPPVLVPQESLVDHPVSLPP